MFGENAEAHDKAFKKVLQRLAEKGLTLNLEKCLFHKESLEYFGFIFSKEGVKPSPTKTAALKNVDRPRDVKAVRSFLGLTNYLKRFIDDYSSITYFYLLSGSTAITLGLITLPARQLNSVEKM